MMRFAVQAQAKDGSYYGVGQAADGNFSPVRIVDSTLKPVMKGKALAYKGDNPRLAFEALIRHLERKGETVNWLRVPMNMAASPLLVDYQMDRIRGIITAVRAGK